MNVTGEVTITDNSEEYRRMLRQRVGVIADEIGRQAERYAKEECPVDTGRLRNSITFAVENNTTIYIGSNLPYAEKQETDGTLRHTVGRAHFLRDAATQHNDEYKNIVRAGLDY